jgi:RNA polymerase sigma-70 factor, ECF subfamily
MAVNRVANQIPGAAAPLDPESAEWLRALADTGPRREAALTRLHGMLLRIAQRECRRRGPRLRITGLELEDVAYQAAADALMAITAKLAVRLGSNRNAIYKMMFDTRRKLRAALAANGYLTHHTPGGS